MSLDISIITNKLLISQEVALAEYIAGQSAKDYYSNSEYLYYLNVK